MAQSHDTTLSAKYVGQYSKLHTEQNIIFPLIGSQGALQQVEPMNTIDT